MIKQQTMQVPETILSQLGGGRFIAMTGSHSFRGDGNKLVMNLRRNKVKAKWLTIELTVMDTYTMTFEKMCKGEVVTLAQYEGVYYDQLQAIFKKVTGLDTSL